MYLGNQLQLINTVSKTAKHNLTSHKVLLCIVVCRPLMLNNHDFTVMSPYGSDSFIPFLGFRLMTSTVLVQSTDQHMH